MPADQDLIAFENMDYKSAKEYLYSFLKSQKTTEQALNEEQEKFKLWSDRIELAKKSGNTQLASEAEKVALQHQNKIHKLNQELSELKLKTSTMMDMLKRKSKFEPEVNVDLLQSEFEMLLGDYAKETKINKEISEEKIADELEKLKKEMGIKGNPSNNTK